MSKELASRLLNVVQRRAEMAKEIGKIIPVRDYFIIHLNLSTGLRVMEVANLKCSDLFLDDRICSVLVRAGKGRKKRLVYFTGPFRKHCHEYLKWKKQKGEPVEPEAPLLMSSNTGNHLSTRAIQFAFKRCAKRACLDSQYSIHCLRHTYACFLLKASNWNLRLVQKQLGHSRISTTQIYADVMMPDVEKALNRLFL